MKLFVRGNVTKKTMSSISDGKKEEQDTEDELMTTGDDMGIETSSQVFTEDHPSGDVDEELRSLPKDEEKNASRGFQSPEKSAAVGAGANSIKKEDRPSTVKINKTDTEDEQDVPAPPVLEIQSPLSPPGSFPVYPSPELTHVSSDGGVLLEAELVTADIEAQQRAAIRAEISRELTANTVLASVITLDSSTSEVDTRTTKPSSHARRRRSVVICVISAITVFAATAAIGLILVAPWEDEKKESNTNLSTPESHRFAGSYETSLKDLAVYAPYNVPSFQLPVAPSADEMDSLSRFVETFWLARVTSVYGGNRTIENTPGHTITIKNLTTTEFIFPPGPDFVAVGYATVNLTYDHFLPAKVQGTGVALPPIGRTSFLQTLEDSLLDLPNYIQANDPQELLTAFYFVDRFLLQVLTGGDDGPSSEQTEPSQTQPPVSKPKPPL